MYEIYIPQSEILQKYIYSFYVLEEFSQPLNYLAFPQVGMTLAFFLNTAFQFNDKGIIIGSSKETTPKILLLGKYKIPIQIKYECFVPEISINFTPTGLNYFFEKNTCDLAKDNAQLIDQEKWLIAANKIFHEKSNTDKIKKLENFLDSIFFKKDLSLIENYLSILKENPERTISNIAAELKVSSKTINRAFSKYLGCSAMDYKQILRFRKAVNIKFNSPSDNLTHICLDSNFYDSPHFTREFKKLTHLSPKDFFAEIEVSADQQIPYQFL